MKTSGSRKGSRMMSTAGGVPAKGKNGVCDNFHCVCVCVMDDALQNIGACKRILNNLLESTQSVSKLMQQEVDKIAKAYAKETETETFKSSEIVAVYRKLFSSFVEARRNNLHLMKVELGLLQAKENASIAVESDETTETADILKNEVTLSEN
ncbi:uncharacterized protein CEXT_681 [Caerostris extrusa]|uniref:Uncharacterized protein n=1 Tax=Caerostris extrusa TaxID=172846 RepID=A0AAV4RSW9_CAEEX|nr:uncharacterized protein CEXT_681 [Caerostris extrusa]